MDESFRCRQDLNRVWFRLRWRLPTSYLIGVEHPRGARDEVIFRNLLARIVCLRSPLDLLEENDKTATLAFPDLGIQRGPLPVCRPCAGAESFLFAGNP